MGSCRHSALWICRCVAVIFCSVSLRVIIFATLGDDLQHRVELSNVFNGLRGIKEAAALIRHRLSPYSGSGVRAPPLAILILRHVIGSWWALWPFTVADVACAGLLYLISRHLKSSRGSDRFSAVRKIELVAPPAVVALISLCNPLTILTSCSSSLASFSQLLLIFAVYGAVVLHSPVIAAVGLALASYLDLYTFGFCLPLASILVTSGEDMMDQPCSSCLKKAWTPVDVTAKLKQRRCHKCTSANETDDTDTNSVPRGAWITLCFFAGVLWMCTAALVVMSDAAMLSWSAGDCLEWLDKTSETPPSLDSRSLHSFVRTYSMSVSESVKKGCCWVEYILADHIRDPAQSHAQAAYSSTVSAQQPHADWISKSYGGVLAYDDLSPNIGLWWYFIGEMFQEFRHFFKFVLHSQILVFSVPITVRFWRRPLFAFLLHAMLMAIFKPYPVAADVALYLNLLPLFVPVLGWAQPALVVGFIMHVAAIMGPATLYQWLHTGSANSNFFYAMTLVWAGAQVFVMLLVTFAVKQHDVDLSKQAQLFRLPGCNKG